LDNFGEFYLLEWIKRLFRRDSIPNEIETEDRMDSISTNIPTSFVKRQIKLIDDKGNGEAKLYIGSTDDVAEFEKFFSYWKKSNVYAFDRENLITYLDDAADEYLKNDKYQQVSKSYHRGLVANVTNSKTKDLRVYLEVYSDRLRYYIRSVDQENDFWGIFRMIALPLISELEIYKIDEDGHSEYLFYLWRSDTPRIRAHTRKGSKVTLHPDHTRYIPKSLKREVDKRDRRMCQANWRLDPKLDKTSRETCDSNKHLHYDHIVPYSRGGLTTLNNLQLLCRKHNLKKSDKIL
jgi:5-methylcytosine-specific restriction endonuclease McrA